MNALVQFDKADLGYGRQPILKSVTCSIFKNDYVGLVGPNGSGKTTFLKTVLGLLPCLQGSAQTNRQETFAYVPQIEESNLLWPLSVEEVVSLALRSRHPFGRLSLDEKNQVQSALEKTGLSSLKNELFSRVSGGQRQRTVLAQALCQSPRVLLLDEPTRGLDVVVERDFLNLVAELKQKEQLTILFVTHTLAIPLNFADKIFLFTQNTVTPVTVKDIIETRKLEEIYGVPFVHYQKDGIRWVSPTGLRT